VLPSLGELFGIGIPIGGLLGGIVGFAARAPTSRDLVRNVVDGATVGGLLGTATCLAIWIGGTAAGG
jgi:hypothetical protein